MKNENRDIIKPEKGKRAGERIIKSRRREPALSATIGHSDGRSPEAPPRFLPSCLPGCGGGRRGKLHYPLLHSAGCRGLPPPHREPQHLRPGWPVYYQSGREAPEAGHLRSTLLLLPGVQHPRLLSGWHPRCPEGKWLLPDPPFVPLHQSPSLVSLPIWRRSVCARVPEWMNTNVWPQKMLWKKKLDISLRPCW